MNNIEIISGSFRWLSDDVFPIDTERIAAIDNHIDLSPGWRFWIKLFLWYSSLFLSLFRVFLLYIGRQRK